MLFQLSYGGLELSKLGSGPRPLRLVVLGRGESEAETALAFSEQLARDVVAGVGGLVVDRDPVDVLL